MAKIIIFGGEYAVEKGNYIREKIRSQAVVNLCGKISLLEVAFIFKNLNFKHIITMNASLMHMSSRVNQLVIRIFSSAKLN